MKITKEEIDAAKTKNGGWSRETLNGWGIPWPPPNGWKAHLVEHGCGCSNCATNYTAALSAVSLVAKYAEILAQHHVARGAVADDRNEIAGAAYDVRKQINDEIGKLIAPFGDGSCI